MGYTWFARLTAFAVVLSSGCSDSTDGNSTADGGAPAADTGTDSAADPGKVLDHGVMVSFDTGRGLEGVTVTDGTTSTTTAADGSWSIRVAKGVSYVLSFSKEGFVPENYPEASLSRDVDRGKIKLVPQDTYDLATGAFDGFDPTHGLLYIEVNPVGSCASINGGTLHLADPGVAQIRYTHGGFPSAVQASIDEKELPLPVALFYNVPGDTQLDVSLADSPCELAPFPYTDEATGITYTGSVQVHGVASTIGRYFTK